MEPETTSRIQPPQGGPMTMVSTNRPPLRRAVYVHVSDLTSPYNIDHTRLEEEIERVRAEKEVPVEASSAARLGVPTELDTSLPQRRLQPPRGGYNLCVLVGKVHLVVDKNRVDGSRVRLAEVEVGDETGTVSLRARDDQIDVLMEVSERSGAVVLRNCTLELYQGRHIRLAVTKWGKMSRYPDSVPSTPPPPSKINHDRNFSLIDLSLVASEMAPEFPQSDSQQSSETEGPQQQQQQQQQQSQSQQQTQMAGRPRSFSQQSQSQPRRGSRRSVRTKPSGQPSAPTQQQPQAQPHYTESTGMGYPGGLHGYGTGFEGSMSQQQSHYQYNVRRQEQLPPAQQHQQMMMHHQYEMQQRHMQQLYQPQREGNPPPSSPMVGPGAPSQGSFDVPSQGSFDSHYTPAGDVQMPMIGSNPFLNAPPSQQPPPPPPQQQQQRRQQQQQQQPLPHPTYLQSVTGTRSRPSREGDPPASPSMNPQAATFDPSTGGPAG